jgi:hypothetical protein
VKPVVKHSSIYQHKPRLQHLGLEGIHALAGEVSVDLDALEGLLVGISLAEASADGAGLKLHTMMRENLVDCKMRELEYVRLRKHASKEDALTSNNNRHREHANKRLVDKPSWRGGQEA